ncbi:MAG: ABC transporter permease [Oscillospiraceae bacterium]|jgi:peptide/nickel transport system permease protein|nr:ABC transporter permease [Oscillospiraceae bacterium]
MNEQTTAFSGSLRRTYNRKLIKRQLDKFLRNKLSVTGTAIMIVVLLVCIIYPFFSPHDYKEIHLAIGATAPSAQHLFGTDNLGRDLFVRTMIGGRYSITIGLLSALCSAAIGVAVGATAGYFGGKMDRLLLRATELFQTFPQLVLNMVLAAVLGRSIFNLILIFTCTGWMSTARLVRNEFLSLREETYVKVSEAFGMKKTHVMFRQILPNILTPITVSVTACIPGYILSEASLSFLGLGVGETTPTWGNIINAGTNLSALLNTWWLWLIPGALLTIFVLSVNFFGDGLRDLLDPRQI